MIYMLGKPQGRERRTKKGAWLGEANGEDCRCGAEVWDFQRTFDVVVGGAAGLTERLGCWVSS